MSDTKIKTSNIGNLAVTHALLHTDMDLTSKTVQVAAPSSNTHPATKLYVDTEVANLIDSAPGTLDTLNELAAAVNDDANFNATIASSIATKLPLAGGTMTGNLQIYKAEPIITLQRSNNALLSGLSWQGSGGAEAASIKLDGTSGATNTLIMSTYNGSTMAERLRLMTNAAGGIAVTGTISVTGTVDGVDIAARDAILTSTTTTANAALPKAGGTLTGDLIINTSSNGMLKLQEGGSDKGYIGAGGGGLYIKNLAGDVIFRNSSDADTIRIKDSGNVGIGTSSPQRTLHVVKNGSIAAGNGYDVAIFQNNDAVGIRLVDAGDGGSNGGNAGLGNDNGNLNVASAGVMTFSTNLAANAALYGGASTGGTERMRIASSGNIGIGESNPSHRLHINGGSNDEARVRVTNTANGQASLDLDNSEGYFRTYTDAGEYRIYDQTDGTHRLVIDTSGKVGIGTSSPSAKLELNVPTGDGLLINSADIATIKMKNTGGGVANWGFATTNLAASDFGIYRSNSVGGDPITAGSAKMYFNASGNVGIGTTSPTATLQVEGNQTSNPVARFKGTGSSDNPVLTIETHDNGRDPHLRFVRPNGTSGASMVIRGGSGSDWLSIHHLSRGADDQIVIKHNGNIGIGTNSPAEKLDVNGTLIANRIVSDNVNSGDGDDYAAVGLKRDYSAWGVIYEDSWIGTSGGWGSFWAGNGGSAYQRVGSDPNPNEHVLVGSGNKRFTFDLDTGGHAYFDGSLSQNNYDYAEYFEWEDGNPDEEDRRGYTVVLTENGTIRKATSSDDTADIFGAISGTAAVIGDAAMYDWQGKYELDEWGTPIYDTVDQITWKVLGEDGNEAERHSYDEDRVPDGIIVPDNVSRKTHKRKRIVADYVDSNDYVPRDRRPEWDTVGLLGKVRVRDASPKNPRWIYIKTVNGKELWLIR